MKMKSMKCPTCREPIRGKLPRVNVMIRGMVEKHYPEEYKKSITERELVDAVTVGDVKKVAGLLKDGCDPNSSLNPLWYACHHDHSEVAKQLVHAGAQVCDNSFASACLGTDESLVQLLIDRGARVNCNTAQGSPLGIAITGHNLQMVRLLVHAGASVTAKTLREALTNVEILSYLLTLIDANNRDDDNMTPLHHYASHGRYGSEILQSLINAGADLQCTDNQGRTALHISAYFGHQHVLESLIRAGANPNSQDIYGETPLHDLVQSVAGNAQNVIMLINAGADVNAVSVQNETPLLSHVTCTMPSLEIIRALLMRGADPNTQDSYGNTALHHCISTGFLEIIGLLLEWRAKINLENNYGRTALEHAQDLGFQKIVDVLILAG